MTWQPIETAPEDQRLLVFGKLDYENGPDVYQPDYIYRERDGLIRFVLDGGPVESQYGTATHWMPLPDPPTTLKAVEG